jgi:hypothetical protein
MRASVGESDKYRPPDGKMTIQKKDETSSSPKEASVLRASDLLVTLVKLKSMQHP